MGSVPPRPFSMQVAGSSRPSATRKWPRRWCQQRDVGIPASGAEKSQSVLRGVGGTLVQPHKRTDSISIFR